jgi:hypothetical protein
MGLPGTQRSWAVSDLSVVFKGLDKLREVVIRVCVIGRRFDIDVLKMAIVRVRNGPPTGCRLVLMRTRLYRPHIFIIYRASAVP